MPMIMFRVNQWVVIRKSDDPKLRNQKGVVIRVNDDDTARVRLNKRPDVVVTVDPQDCDPVS